MGRIFCTQCGAKLDVEAGARKDLSQARARRFRSLAIRFLLLDVLIFVVVVAVLALWPAAGSLDSPDAKHFARAKARIQALDRGLRATESFNEMEINAVIAERFGKRLKKANSSIDVFLKPESVKVVVRSEIGPWNLGAFSLGPFPFTYTVRGQPEHRDGAFAFKPEAGAVGHLPLFGSLKNMAVDSLAELLEGRENVRAFLDRIEGFNLMDGAVDVVMSKPEP